MNSGAVSGIGELAIKILAATCYSRLVLFERPLDESLPELDARIEAEYSLLAAADVDEYVTVVPAASAERVREWLARGDRCFGAVHRGRLVGVSWARTGRVSIPYLRASLRLRDDEALVSDAFVAPEWRGRGVSPSLGSYRLRWLQAAGYSRALATVQPENEAGLVPPQKLGYRRIGTVYGVGLGPGRKAVIVRERGRRRPE